MYYCMLLAMQSGNAIKFFEYNSIVLAKMMIKELDLNPISMLA